MLGVIADCMSKLYYFSLLFLLTGCTTQMGHPKVEFHGSNCATIPIEEWSGGHGHVPVVQFSKDGVVGRFIVDTGASVSMFTMTAVRSWHLSASDVPNSLHLADGSHFDTKFVKNVTLDLERTSIRVHFDEAYVLPGDLPYFGLIGYDFLKATHAVIDVDKSNIAFSP